MYEGEGDESGTSASNYTMFIFFRGVSVYTLWSIVVTYSMLDAMLWAHRKYCRKVLRASGHVEETESHRIVQNGL